jgi:hypothetical protein
MSQKAILAVIIGVLAVVAALAVKAIVPAADLTTITDSIDLAALVIGFFLTIYGSVLVGQLAIDGLRANSTVTASDVAIASLPAATGALLMLASGI